jgi:fructoselysine-6-P-deglycase FrlB-like protein
MTTLTPHEQQQRDAEVAQERARTFHAERLALTRLCPAGLALDEEHLIALLADHSASNRIILMTRHFTILGLLGAGYTAEWIGPRWSLTADAVEADRARAIWWSPGDDLLARMSDDTRLAYSRGHAEPRAEHVSPSAARPA